MITTEPLALAEPSFENACTLVELIRFGFDGFLVGLAFHEWLHHIFDQVDIGSWEPGRSFPQQPAIDLNRIIRLDFCANYIDAMSYAYICALLEVFWVHSVVTRFIRGIHQDGILCISISIQSN
jgi:hypothetical protein